VTTSLPVSDHQPRFPKQIARAALRFVVCLFTVFGASVASAQSTVETIEQVAPKIVKIFGAGGRKNLYSYGSGFLYSPDGHIATAWSHILDGETVGVVLHDGRRFEAAILSADPALDLAVLKIDAEQLPHFDLQQPIPSVSVGSRVLAFSNVFKVATGDEPVSVMHGVIASMTNLSARRGVFEAPYTGPVYIVDSVTNNSGAAGGALTTRDGRLLGMLGKELRNNATDTWLNYVVPIGQMRASLEDIRFGRYTPKPKSDDPETVLAPRRFVPEDFGLVLIPDVVQRTPVYIDRVLPGSAAERAGLASDDLVLFADDQLTPSCRMFRDELARRESNRPLKLVVRRDDRLITVELPTPPPPSDAE
jgi:serine protease Do